MLSPDFLDKLPESVVELFRQIEEDILLDMARRISKTDRITDTAAWQAWRYEQSKLVSSNALKTLAKATNKSKAELTRLFQLAALETLQNDGKIYTQSGIVVPDSLSPTLQNILQSGYLQTGQAMENFTATTANTVTREFENALDRAWLQMNTGAFSYQQSIRQAILNLAQNGLHSVIYPSGHKDTIEVAVRRAVLTGINQTAAKLQIARMDELDCDLVETTAHPGARPSHAQWQGKIFSCSGTYSKYPDFVSSTGYGTGAGLCGWNCRHNFFPCFEGMSKPAYSGSMLEEFEEKTFLKKEGDIHFLTDHNATMVDCSYLGDKMKGSYNIHTYPPDYTQYSFSADVDIPAAFADGTAVMEAVDYKYCYRFEVPKNITWEQWESARGKVTPKLLSIL